MKSNFELQKISEWWLDVSKISLGSLVVKIFEPGQTGFSLRSVIILVAGVFASVVCARLGLMFARRV